MILASDGVWEFISSQEAVDKVAGSLDKGCMRATQVLIEAAAQRWREVEGDYRDGMYASNYICCLTVVIVLLAKRSTHAVALFGH